MIQVFLFAVLISSGISSTPRTKCTFKGKVRDHDHCISYLECFRGFVLEGTCERGQYFSPTFSSCVPIPEKDCVLDPTGLDLTNQTCPVDGNKLPGILSCDTYFHCRNGTYVEEECPSHKSFSASSGACVDNDFDEACHRHSNHYQTQAYISKEASPYERKCANGSSELLADPIDCGLYVKCVWNGERVAQLIIGECERGKLFDETTKACENAEEVLCGERFRNPDLYRDRAERMRREPRRAFKPGRRLKTKPVPKAGRYALPTTKPRAAAVPPWWTPNTASPSATIASKPKGRQAGRGIFLGGIPRKANVSSILEAKRKDFIQNEGFPEFSIQKLPGNHLIRRKRRLKTKVRKTETEFFDEQGNFTNVTAQGKFMNVRPKMRVRLIETETIYDDSDEDKERVFRKNKTPEQVALKIEKDMDKLMDATTAGSISGRGAIFNRSNIFGGSAANSNREILPRRTTGKPKRKHKRRKRPQVDASPPAPVHYMDYEAPPGAEDVFAPNLPEE